MRPEDQARVRRVADDLTQAVDRWRRFATAHPTAAAATGAATLFLITMALAAAQDGPKLTPLMIGIAALVSASFAVVPAMRWPAWLVTAAATTGTIVLIPAGAPESVTRPCLGVAVFLLALRSEVVTATIATAAACGALVVAGAVQDGYELANLAVVPSIVAAAALGQAIRANAARRAMLVDRAQRAEQSREDEARRRVQAERLRIARELHDAVGHHVALINVQAGAMTYLLDKDLTKARESLGHIQNASESALDELRLTVGLLRQPGEHEPVEPAGRLSRLDELIASFTATGLRVTCEVLGLARPLPDAVDLTAYRLIQESLTNTAKHAAGACVSVRLIFAPDSLALTVQDDGLPAGGPPRGRTAGRVASPIGHGIIGMRERAAALGGRLCAGPRPEGGFQVTADLPTTAVATA